MHLQRQAKWIDLSRTTVKINELIERQVHLGNQNINCSRLGLKGFNGLGELSMK